jgi:hypothetical protein
VVATTPSLEMARTISAGTLLLLPNLDLRLTAGSDADDVNALPLALLPLLPSPPPLLLLLDVVVVVVVGAVANNDDDVADPRDRRKCDADDAETDESEAEAANGVGDRSGAESRDSQSESAASGPVAVTGSATSSSSEAADGFCVGAWLLWNNRDRMRVANDIALADCVRALPPTAVCHSQTASTFCTTYTQRDSCTNGVQVARWKRQEGRRRGGGCDDDDDDEDDDDDDDDDDESRCC